MSKIQGAVREISALDELSRRDCKYNRIHPLSKLLVTLTYLVCLVSFKGNELTGVLGMAIYPFIIFEVTGLSFGKALYRLRFILPLVCIVGIFNPIMNKTAALEIGGIVISEGMLAFFTLMLKGILSVLASYLLIATTSVEKLCFAMRKLHIPAVIVTEFMLIYRYIAVIGKEAEVMTRSYELRAPGQKGVNWRSWGPMIGQLLLRSMDRADVLYQSMCCRGYHDEFPFSGTSRMRGADRTYLFMAALGIILLRLFPLPELVGRLLNL